MHIKCVEKATNSAKQTPLKNYRIRASIIQINIDFPPSVELARLMFALIWSIRCMARFFGRLVGKKVLLHLHEVC